MMRKFGFLLSKWMAPTQSKSLRRPSRCNIASFASFDKGTSFLFSVSSSFSSFIGMMGEGNAALSESAVFLVFWLYILLVSAYFFFDPHDPNNNKLANNIAQ